MEATSQRGATSLRQAQMNPYFLLASVIAWAASVGGAFFYGQGIGKDSEIATQSREDKVAVIATEAAASAAAYAISKLEIKHATIRQTLQREVIEKPVFRDCRSGADAARMLNDTIGAPAAASAASGGQLPPPGPTR